MARSMGRKPAAMMLVGVLSMLGSLLILAAPAGAHQAFVGERTAVACGAQTLFLNFQATSWSQTAPSGRHPNIIVEMRTDLSGWKVVGTGAFTDANGRSFAGKSELPKGASTVEVRVTPDPSKFWDGTDIVGAGNGAVMEVPPFQQVCKPGEKPEEKPTEKPEEKPTEKPEKPEVTPTAEASASASVTPKETPTESPTEAPTETPTEAPTETPTEAPTETPTESPTEAPTETPTESPTPTATPEELTRPRQPTPGVTPQPTTAPPEAEQPEVRGRELARTGSESGMLAVAAMTLLIGGAMLTIAGVALSRRLS